jgi:hypothetical protein
MSSATTPASTGGRAGRRRPDADAAKLVPRGMPRVGDLVPVVVREVRGPREDAVQKNPRFESDPDAPKPPRTDPAGDGWCVSDDERPIEHIEEVPPRRRFADRSPPPERSTPAPGLSRPTRLAAGAGSTRRRSAW